MDGTTFNFCPITTDNWLDFEMPMESKGAPHSCWCTAWINLENKKADKSEKKAAMKQRIKRGIPVGLLVYSENEPLGWCAVAPRDTYRPLGGDETKPLVWSVVCFFIKRKFRGQGLSKLLLDEAIEFAKANGAKYIEGYPVAPDSPSYRFMGFNQLFESADFKFVKAAGARRNVMLRKLD